MAPRGQASHKPRGRKPRHAPMAFGEAKLLWGFDGAQAGVMHPPAKGSADDILPMRDGDDARPVSGITRMPTKHVVAA